MPFDLIFKTLIWIFVGAGMFQINKWLQFKEQDNKWKEGWNNFIMLLCIIVYIATAFYLYEDNL